MSKSKTESISSGNWYFTAYTETRNDTTTDILAVIDPRYEVVGRWACIHILDSVLSK